MSIFGRESKKQSKKAMKTGHRVRVAVPFGNGAGLSPKSPPISSAQHYAYANELAAIPRPLGGAAGCSYTGWEYGVVCQNTGGMPSYSQAPGSYTGNWHGNVKGGFPHPEVQTPGGYEQIMMGGGSGSSECAQVCTCAGDPTCPCRNGPGQSCGYSSVNQTCVEPYPGGEYASLSACEAANSRGQYR